VCVAALTLASLAQGTVLEPVEFFQKSENNAGAWGKAVATIDASAARVFAGVWCLNSHGAKREYSDYYGSNNALRRVIHIRPNSHSMIYVNLVPLGMAISDRVFATWFCWRKEPDNSFVITWTPLEDYAVESADTLSAQVKNFTAAQEEQRYLTFGSMDAQAQVKAFEKDAEELKLLMLQIESRNSALLLLVRAFSAAMLMLVKKRYLFVCLAGDMALYLLQKVARGDFHYWLPVDGALGLLISLLARVITKTITDFTGVIQFRGDPELGGLFWTVNMFLALLTCFLSVIVYYAGTGEEVELITNGQNSKAFEIEEGVSWTLVGSLSGAWVVVFVVFLLLMKKEYRRTFFTTRTGKQWAVDFFVKGVDDGQKSAVLTCNKKQWRAIREDVKEWVQANWWRWKEEKPKWFSLAWQSKVPKEWITDVEERARLDKVRERGRRRSSVEKIEGVFGKGEEEVRGGARVEPVA